MNLWFMLPSPYTEIASFDAILFIHHRLWRHLIVNMIVKVKVKSMELFTLYKKQKFQQKENTS